MTLSPPIDGAAVERTVMAGLKDFQRRTVDYVFRRLYTDADATDRFLVADEVGLGKTLVARGLIAKAIRHLQQDPGRRIDIIYVCSNADIAAQNVRRLNVTGRDDFALASRITLLPLHLRHLNTHGINFVSFTPGTSFDFGHRTGQVTERALLFRLLEAHWGHRAVHRAGVYRLLQGSVRSLDRFKEVVRYTPSRIGDGEGMIDRTLAESFGNHLDAAPDLRERFFDLADSHRRSAPDGLWWPRQEMVGELRRVLARSCIAALEPDLIILDEFQRFRHLLESPDPDNPDDVRALAHDLFDQPDAKVLMLSATPYKMYSLADESDDDHYRDFVQTARFLLGDASADALAGELRLFRREMLSYQSQPARIRKTRRHIEDRLRKVMARTERLSVTPDRGGMLVRAAMDQLSLRKQDLAGYVTAQRVSQRLGAGDPFEYWKSAPYLLNYMEGYKLKRQIEQMGDAPATGADVASILRDAHAAGLLNFEQIRNYARIDPGNARMRALFADTLDRGAWKQLWLSPALPYYTSGPAFDEMDGRDFTKRLIFSSWTLAPQAISSILSYEAERRMMTRSGRRRNTPQARKAIRGLLRIGREARDGGRLVGMPVFALLYPSPVLARIGDPLSIWAEAGPAVEPLNVQQVRETVRGRVARHLAPLVRGAPTTGAVDEAWYWVAPLLLDRAADPSYVDDWLGRADSPDKWAGKGELRGSEGEESSWNDHVALAHAAHREVMGRVPDDLADVVASVAIGGPANAALRALSRVTGGSPALTEDGVRDAAARIAWGFRTLFNIPEVMGLVRTTDIDDSPYWRQVLEYCISGNLQAVLDEYLHILPESLGIIDRPAAVDLDKLAAEIYSVVALRAANYGVDDLTVTGEEVQLQRANFRARFALRFGVRASDEQAELQRSGGVRAAFNSPFWPFVLASTSLGQEGLDFHQYCHAVIHWNLPANPVDMEQREGRVHRFKGHAVRKNVARAHAAAAKRARGRDPWRLMFDAARPPRVRGQDRDLVPYWIYEGHSKIERYVPALPLSRDVEKYEQLRRSLASYRLVFGQPRQEDMVAFLGARVGSDDTQARFDELRIDLTPR